MALEAKSEFKKEPRTEAGKSCREWAAGGERQGLCVGTGGTGIRPEFPVLHTEVYSRHSVYSH